MELKNRSGVEYEQALAMLHHEKGRWFANVPKGLRDLLENPYVYVNVHARVEGMPGILRRPFNIEFSVLKESGSLKFMATSGVTGQSLMSVFMAKGPAPGPAPASFVELDVSSVHPHEPLSVGVLDPRVEAQVHVGGTAAAVTLLYEAAMNPTGYLASLNALDQVQAIGGDSVPESEKYIFVLGDAPYDITYLDADSGVLNACNLNRGTIDDANPRIVVLTEVIIKPYP
jgi:hypothetical protein